MIWGSLYDLRTSNYLIIARPDGLMPLWVPLVSASGSPASASTPSASHFSAPIASPHRPTLRPGFSIMVSLSNAWAPWAPPFLENELDLQLKKCSCRVQNFEHFERFANGLNLISKLVTGGVVSLQKSLIQLVLSLLVALR